jgi:hypothetical protein
VSVARANDVSHIEARITELKTAIPLTVDDFERDQWIIKAERAEFITQTNLDDLRPDNQVSVTEPGRYEIMLHHINVHQYLRNQELAQCGSARQLNWEQAVCSWYDTVYMPVIEMIRKHNLLKGFPNRTETDLYLWLAYHRERLAREYDLAPLDPETAVQTFASLHDDNPWARTWKGLRQGFHRIFVDEIPLGMSEEDFETLRARHDAGEISLSEAEAVDDREAAEETAHPELILS